MILCLEYFVYIYMFVSLYVCMSVCMYVCMYVCMCVCVLHCEMSFCRRRFGRVIIDWQADHGFVDWMRSHLFRGVSCMDQCKAQKFKRGNCPFLGCVLGVDQRNPDTEDVFDSRQPSYTTRTAQLTVWDIYWWTCWQLQWLWVCCPSCFVPVFNLIPFRSHSYHYQIP